MHGSVRLCVFSHSMHTYVYLENGEKAAFIIMKPHENKTHETVKQFTLIPAHVFTFIIVFHRECITLQQFVFQWIWLSGFTHRKPIKPVFVYESHWVRKYPCVHYIRMLLGRELRSGKECSSIDMHKFVIRMRRMFS